MSLAPLAILCVESDADIRLIVELSLRLDPTIVAHCAANVPSAIDQLAKGFDPDIILIDTSLPATRGLEAAQQIIASASNPAPIVIFLTSSVNVSRRHRQSPLGRMRSILKPFDPLTLAAEIRRLMSEPV